MVEDTNQRQLPHASTDSQYMKVRFVSCSFSMHSPHCRRRGASYGLDVGVASPLLCNRLYKFTCNYHHICACTHMPCNTLLIPKASCTVMAMFGQNQMYNKNSMYDEWCIEAIHGIPFVVCHKRGFFNKDWDSHLETFNIKNLTSTLQSCSK